MRIYRWDLDKTYLQTDFDSFKGLVRSATEPASAKQAVPGAPVLLRAMSEDDGARIFFVSGSPTQMREVLEEKLRLDGVRFDRLTLKDNLGNLRRGRVRAIKGQFGYKLPQLLRDRQGEEPGSRETLFGDDAEVDALVYCAYADAVNGRLSASQVARVMHAAGAYGDDVDAAVAALATVPTAALSERIFIRLERRRPTQHFRCLGTRVVPVVSWWQAALVLLADGDLRPAHAADVAQAVFGERDDAAWALAAQTQDIYRRGCVTADEVAEVPLPVAWRGAVLRALQGCPAPSLARRRGPPDVLPDYAALLATWDRKDWSP